MSKLKQSLLSLDATGSLGKVISFVKRAGTTIAEKRPVPKDAKSTAQLAWRHMYTKCIDLWHDLSAAEKQEWESAARPKHMTGYAWFISQCLRPNPGIYLPLQGGTMQGDISMDGHKITDLPAPVAANDAVRKAYVDALPAESQGRINIIPNAYSSIGQGAWAMSIDANQFMNFYWWNVGVNGDNISYDIYLDAGTYTLAIMGAEHSNRGIMDVYIDAAEVASFDWYRAAGLLYNVWNSQANIVIATAGRKTLKLLTDGKDPGSSSWTQLFSFITLWRTA